RSRRSAPPSGGTERSSRAGGLEVLIYVYALLATDPGLSIDSDEGLEPGHPVRLVRVDRVAAAVSDVGPDFDTDRLNHQLQDLDWLSPRAVRHHAIVDRVYARSRTILPLAFGTVFRSESSLVRRLTRQQGQLLELLKSVEGKDEWDLKVTRENARFRAGLLAENEALRSLERDIEHKPPGTAFMLRKKLERAQIEEARIVRRRIRADVQAGLSAHATDSRVDDLPAADGEAAITLELKSAYLLSSEQADGMERASRELAERYSSLGYSFELTGPWPPYSFVGRTSAVLR
ncbi:MAG: GvpL/GvpF family gas vesicle protein, partial [Chloroflexota bacterium]|nr:GvpL/GvpF family gas vesicle protein [Chloroflexota bacterium]